MIKKNWRIFRKFCIQLVWRLQYLKDNFKFSICDKLEMGPKIVLSKNTKPNSNVFKFGKQLQSSEICCSTHWSKCWSMILKVVICSDTLLKASIAWVRNPLHLSTDRLIGQCWNTHSAGTFRMVLGHRNQANEAAIEKPGS